MTVAREKFNQIVQNFKSELEQLKKENGLDEGDIFIQLNPCLGNIGGMKDGDGNRIEDIGFLPEVEFILVANH